MITDNGDFQTGLSTLSFWRFVHYLDDDISLLFFYTWIESLCF